MHISFEQMTCLKSNQRKHEDKVSLLVTHFTSRTIQKRVHEFNKKKKLIIFSCIIKANKEKFGYKQFLM